MKRTAAALAALSLSLGIFVLFPAPASARATEVAPPEVLADAARAAIGYVATLQVEEAVAGLGGDVAAYVADVQAAEAAAWAAAHPPPRASSTSVVRSGEVGECTGFVIPSYIIQRESGGSSTAMNPSGAYGCAQTLLSHYASGGACAGDNPYTIQGQRDCVYTLSNGGTNLSPWAQTR